MHEWFCSGRLAEADARIEQDLSKGDASRRRNVERASEEPLDIVENVDRRIDLVPVVHDDHRRARLRDRVRHAWIALKSPDVVDGASAEPRRLARDRSLRRIDRDRGVQIGQRLEHRNDAPEFLGLGDGTVAGPGRFAA